MRWKHNNHGRKNAYLPIEVINNIKRSINIHTLSHRYEKHVLKPVWNHYETIMNTPADENAVTKYPYKSWHRFNLILIHNQLLHRYSCHLCLTSPHITFSLCHHHSLYYHSISRLLSLLSSRLFIDPLFIH